MAKLSAREIDAVVETTKEQIREFNSNSPEQVEYEKQLKICKDLDEECEKKGRELVKAMMAEYQEKYPDLEFKYCSYNNRVDMETRPKQPKSNVNKSTIERELIVANISGNVQETINKIVEKYTTQK